MNTQRGDAGGKKRGKNHDYTNTQSGGTGAVETGDDLCGSPLNKKPKQDDSTQEGNQKPSRRPHKCGACGQSWARKASAESHIDKIHKDVRPRPEAVPLDEEEADGFYKKQGRGPEEKGEPGMPGIPKPSRRPHECSECGHWGAKKITIDVHIDAVHKNENPRPTAVLSTRVRPEKAKSGAVKISRTPHRCTGCGYAGTRKGVVAIHIEKSHMGDDPQPEAVPAEIQPNLDPTRRDGRTDGDGAGESTGGSDGNGGAGGQVNDEQSESAGGDVQLVGELGEESAGETDGNGKSEVGGNGDGLGEVTYAGGGDHGKAAEAREIPKTPERGESQGGGGRASQQGHHSARS